MQIYLEKLAVLAISAIWKDLWWGCTAIVSIQFQSLVLLRCKLVPFLINKLLLAIFLHWLAAAAAIPAKPKGPSTPKSPRGSSKLSGSSAQPKSYKTDKPKEKPRSSAGETQQPKTHDAYQEHRTVHRANLPRDGTKVGISAKDGPKEIFLEVMQERSREAFSNAVHRDGAAHQSAAARRSGSSKHLEEPRSKPLPAPATAQHRLSSDSQSLPGQADPKSTSEARLSTKLVCMQCSRYLCGELPVWVSCFSIFCAKAATALACLSHRNSFRLSVHPSHGGLVKNGAS